MKLAVIELTGSSIADLGFWAKEIITDFFKFFLNLYTYSGLDSISGSTTLEF
jgi:hypothetical protein